MLSMPFRLNFLSSRAAAALLRDGGRLYEVIVKIFIRRQHSGVYGVYDLNTSKLVISMKQQVEYRIWAFGHPKCP